VLTDCPEFAEADFVAARGLMRTALVLDGRNTLPAARVREAGLVLLRIGEGGTEAGHATSAVGAGKVGRV